MSKKDNEFVFDKALKRLEQIAAELEDNDLPLEKSLEYLKEANELKEMCQKAIKDAKLQIELYSKDGTMTPISEEELG